jgi:hypothetical protein
VGGNFTCNGSMPSPFWAACHINTAGDATSQKGRHLMTVNRAADDLSAYDCSFPAHPDGNRAIVLHSSSEFHSLHRGQTSTSLRLYTRKSNNQQGVEGNGDVCIVIMA